MMNLGLKYTTTKDAAIGFLVWFKWGPVLQVKYVFELKFEMTSKFKWHGDIADTAAWTCGSVQLKMLERVKKGKGKRS